MRGRLNPAWRSYEMLSARKIRRLEYAADCLCRAKGKTVRLALLEVYGSVDLEFRWLCLD